MDWIRTKAGLEMAETIIRYLPRITVCLEEIAKVKDSTAVESKIGKAVEELETISSKYSKFGDDEEDSEGIIPSSEIEYETHIYEREE